MKSIFLTDAVPNRARAGRALAAIRAEACCSQNALAREVGVSRTTARRIEAGDHVGLEMFLRYATPLVVEQVLCGSAEHVSELERRLDFLEGLLFDVQPQPLTAA